MIVLVVYVSNPEIRHHELELVDEIYARGILCQQAHANAKHDESPVENLVL